MLEFSTNLNTKDRKSFSSSERKPLSKLQDDSVYVAFFIKTRKKAPPPFYLQLKRMSFQHVLTNTDPPIQAHRHPGHALAAERSLRVDAVAVHTYAWSLTLINVWKHRGSSFLHNTSPHQMSGERTESVQINQFPVEAVFIKILKSLIH